MPQSRTQTAPTIPSPDDTGVLNTQPDSLNAGRNNRFALQFTKIPNVTYFVQSVTLPGVNLGIVEQNNYFVPIPRDGGVKFEDLSLTFKLDEKLKGYRELIGWMRNCSNVEDFTEYDRSLIYSDATLIIQDSNLSGVVKATFKNVIPENLSGIDFEFTQDRATELTANATFKFMTYDLECT